MILLSCERDVYLSDDDIMVIDRKFSPDSSKVLLTYMFDIGALGFSRSWSAILSTKDTLGVINKYTIPDINYPTNTRYEPIKWLNNQTFLLGLNIQSYIRSNTKADTSGFLLNDIQFDVTLLDKNEGLTQIIEHFTVSPDKKKLLVAYKYNGASKIEISVINFYEQLPRYGNIFTSLNFSESPILFGRWNVKNEVEIDVNLNSYMAEYIEFNALLPVATKIKKIDYQSGYSAVIGGWYNRKMFPDADTVHLFKTTESALAEITHIQGWGDSYYTKLLNYFYEYSVGQQTFKSYFRAKKGNGKIGDLIPIEVNPKQPLIHRLELDKTR
ncbi:hypothetical protein [uncultured Roseivirga sp.]|uniref:hypothetical protein n=1 Tax=uncultured Roseivirga sp. TaxID=543088 RepID=UPI0030DCA38D